MIETLNQVVYQSFGLHIASDVPLPELSVLKDDEIKIDVKIKMDDLSVLWDEIGMPGKFVVKEDFVLFRIIDTAIFCVKSGNTILVTPMKQCDEGKMRLFLLGSCMGILLMQRKVLPLHGSVIAINGKAYAFIGDSGAGKSTLAQALIKRGYQLLSDDVIAVAFSENKSPMVLPSYPQQKLWKESLEKFGMEINKYRPLFERETKYIIPIDSSFYSKPLILAGVFELVKSEENKESEILKIQGLQRVHMLFCHTYRHFLINRLGLLQWHLNITTSMVNKMNFFQIKRPLTGFTAHDLSTIILKEILKED